VIYLSNHSSLEILKRVHSRYLFITFVYVEFANIFDELLGLNADHRMLHFLTGANFRNFSVFVTDSLVTYL